MDTIAFVILVGLFGFLGEMIFFLSHVKKYSGRMEFLFKQEKGKSLTGIIGGIGLLVYCAIKGSYMFMSVALLPFSFGILLCVLWKEKKYKGN